MGWRTEAGGYVPRSKIKMFGCWEWVSTHSSHTKIALLWRETALIPWGMGKLGHGIHGSSREAAELEYVAESCCWSLRGEHTKEGQVTVATALHKNDASQLPPRMSFRGSSQRAALALQGCGEGTWLQQTHSFCQY